jgi:hypothetical protein
MFFYSGEKSDFDGDISKINATTACINHYKNFLYLTFMSNNGTLSEKHQAGKEMEICKRKMKFWRQRRDFSEEIFSKSREIENKKWVG